jgi:hypothetical protein
MNTETSYTFTTKLDLKDFDGVQVFKLFLPNTIESININKNFRLDFKNYLDKEYINYDIKVLEESFYLLTNNQNNIINKFIEYKINYKIIKALKEDEISLIDQINIINNNISFV